MRAYKWWRIRNGYYTTRVGSVTVTIVRQHTHDWLLTFSRQDGAAFSQTHDTLHVCREVTSRLLADRGWLRSKLDCSTVNLFRHSC